MLEKFSDTHMRLCRDETQATILQLLYHHLVLSIFRMTGTCFIHPVSFLPLQLINPRPSQGRLWNEPTEMYHRHVRLVISWL